MAHKQNNIPFVGVVVIQNGLGQSRRSVCSRILTQPKFCTQSLVQSTLKAHGEKAGVAVLHHVLCGEILAGEITEEQPLGEQLGSGRPRTTRVILTILIRYLLKELHDTLQMLQSRLR